ncbi:hypothetical protein ACH5RR_028962 [Cinchona calisaya]|uniref:Outer arm dynein light chain 1 protein n=1 Tax=Cinchona calisaya TaxID=153742 RepID=A0ABD2YSH9_9GENT
MMFRFSCFNSRINSHKPKKAIHLSAEVMQKTLEDCSQNEALKDLTYLAQVKSSNGKIERNTLNNSADCATDTCAVESDLLSEEIKSVSDRSVLKASHIKKSQSLGSGLDMKGRDSGGSASEDGIDQQFSCDDSRGNCGGYVVPNGAKDSGTNLPYQFQEALPSDSLHATCDNHESMFSIGDAPQSEKEFQENSDALQSEKEVHENSDAQLSGGAESGTPRTPPVFVKSSSLPNISSPCRPTMHSLCHSRSAEDLSVLYLRRRDTLAHEVGPQVLQHQARNDILITDHKENNGSNHVDDNYGTYNYVGSAKDWIIPTGDEVNVDNSLLGNSSHQLDKLPSRDFKIKRIEEWVTDLQHCCPLEESDEPSTSEDHVVATAKNVLDVPATAQGKVNPGMEAVKKYISSLNPTATAAQLVNHGLVVIPFLSAFSSLRALNLSGNAIVRITAGSLPRGLHILNLSKNNISTVEGLRELTRLRVLDLSYNRILRIGHGLASCSSLKELYFAGNKISEVEGLHRLLKLNVLDLRFNKISTTKCLGQLAANYNSLQAISLEGNPAQKNVGDEQVKKYLQGLLPHLTYFNRQPAKAGTLKDTADRSTRLCVSVHQIDRSLKGDLKTVRKGTHGTAHKVASSSNHGRRSQTTALSKPSKNSRHVRLPPSGTKPATQQNHLYDFSSKLQSLRSDLSMRRSRSEGTLGAL